MTDSTPRTHPVVPAALADALGVRAGGELISLVGGGGKTTSLFALGTGMEGTSILTTTTRMGADQRGDVTILVDPGDTELQAALTSRERVLVWAGSDERRALGVAPARCDDWFGRLAANVVVEADGSRKRPFKAPADYEPVVPSATTLLVACIGVGALGRPITECCHRPERVAELASCDVDDVLTPARAASVLRSPLGSQKGRPDGARFAVAVHRVTEVSTPAVDELASELGDGIELVAVSEVSRPVGS